MKRIIFYNGDHYWGALANNGGSRTILKSAQTLRTLGHYVDVVTNADNFTWFKHSKILKKIPGDADIVIAVSISDVKTVANRAPKGVKLAYWARPVETWQMSKDEAVKRLKRFARQRKATIMCNSEWQKKWLDNEGVPVTVVYAGLDFEEWNDEGRTKSDKPRVGFLLHEHKRKAFPEIEMLVDKLGDKCEYYGYGASHTVDNRIRKWLKHNRKRVNYVLDPTHKELLRLYKSCDWFFAPNTLEGFYNPPSEAALCGAQILCTHARRSGLSDYCLPDTATFYDDISDAADAIQGGTDSEKIANMQKLLRTKIGARKECMTKMMEVLGAK